MIGSVRLALAAGNAAAQSVLEVFLARAGSPVLMLELLRQADLGIDARQREAMLAEAVRRRIADMGEIVARLTGSGEAAHRPSAAQMLRVVADLDALEHKWTISPEDRAALAGLRERAAAGIGSGIECAVEQQILGPLAILTRESLSDDDVERLEDCARNTRRLSIAGAKYMLNGLSMGSGGLDLSAAQRLIDEASDSEDFREGLAAVITVRIPNPQFESQTKIKLTTPEVEGAVNSIIGDGLAKYFEENPATAKLIAQKGQRAAEAREARADGRHNRAPDNRDRAVYTGRGQTWHSSTRHHSH